MRVALHSEIVPGGIADYREHHERIPDGLVATFARAGIASWSIWRSGQRLFHLVECDDWDAATRVLDEDPANAAWQADIGRFVLLFRDDTGAERLAPLELVWDLRDQTDRDRA